MNNGHGNARPESLQVQALQSSPQLIPEVRPLPHWVIENGLSEYVLAARYHAEHGTWPGGIKPVRPSLRGLAIWQCKYVKVQYDRAKYLEWKQYQYDKRAERKKTKPKVVQSSKYSSFPCYTETPDDWQAEFAAKQKLVDQAEAMGLPPFVATYGFLEYVLHSREFAKTGAWPMGEPPVRPPFAGLTLWQIKWIKGQAQPEKYAAQVQKLEERQRDNRAIKRAEERQAQEALIREIAVTPYDQPLPIALTPLGRFVAGRARREVKAA